MHSRRDLVGKVFFSRYEPLLIRRPRTALAILRFGAGTMAPTQKAFRRGDDEQAMRRFASGVLGKEAYEQLPPERKQQMGENLGALRAQLLGAGFPPLAEEEVRGVEAPTLLLTGERSPAVLRRLIDRLHELVPNSRRVEVAAASHRMHEENPGREHGIPHPGPLHAPGSQTRGKRASAAANPA